MRHFQVPEENGHAFGAGGLVPNGDALFFRHCCVCICASCCCRSRSSILLLQWQWRGRSVGSCWININATAAIPGFSGRVEAAAFLAMQAVLDLQKSLVDRRCFSLNDGSSYLYQQASSILQGRDGLKEKQ